jgi:hypothetical protein
VSFLIGPMFDRYPIRPMVLAMRLRLGRHMVRRLRVFGRLQTEKTSVLPAPHGINRKARQASTHQRSSMNKSQWNLLANIDIPVEHDGVSITCILCYLLVLTTIYF